MHTRRVRPLHHTQNTQPNTAVQRPPQGRGRAVYRPEMRAVYPTPASPSVPRARTPFPSPALPQPLPVPTRSRKQAKSKRPWLALAGIGALILSSCLALTLGAGLLVIGSTILPGVTVAGIPIGGHSTTQAEALLVNAWNGQALRLHDPERPLAWPLTPASLGLTLDVDATLRAAKRAPMIPALFGRVDIAPVVSFNSDTAYNTLMEMAASIDLAAVNAGVRLVNGTAQATEAVEGRSLDIGMTVARLSADPGQIVANGLIDLSMQRIAPMVTDASPMLAEASALLANALQIRVYHVDTGSTDVWSLEPESWGEWLTAESDSNSASGLALRLDRGWLENYLASQSTVLSNPAYLDVSTAADAIQNALARGSTESTVSLRYRDRQHIVAPGETITSIAWDYGVPYLYIQKANGGMDSVTTGQTITIPSIENFLPYAVVPNKRIVVSISQQRTWVYENEQLKWEWVASTGITSSPTWPGIYQVLSHEQNAYAGNWNLWMPYFIGIYQPIPDADFTNGFHGFPTREGSQLLWTNSLGTRVTYGCVLLSTDNAQALYDWAETGVIVEIQP